MNIDPRLRVQSQHAAKSITCPGMHGSSFYINWVASTAAKNAVSARHPRGPSVGAERRSRLDHARSALYGGGGGVAEVGGAHALIAARPDSAWLLCGRSGV